MPGQYLETRLRKHAAVVFIGPEEIFKNHPLACHRAFNTTATGKRPVFGKIIIDH
ncbi:hypothetical protein [Endozoicomonas sp. ISHI1]|uniref:hypothetical protein n=1 Tax=Endozoicomonas sp. ISHI1 TaxID=2825882 RepID=UPI0021478F5A|nr:hypothetical protein [Endozoicomonas sp. ISHI1]